MAEVHAALARAELALARNDGVEALAALLEAWAPLRAPALADLITALSEHLAAQRPPPGGASIQAQHETWLSRAATKDPVELGALLPSVAEATSHRALARLRAIADQTPDPRIAARALELLRAPPFVSSATAKFWTQLFRLLVASAGPRTLAQLRELHATAPPPMTSMGERLAHSRGLNIERMAAELAQLELEPDDHSAELLARIGTSIERLRARSDLRGPELLAAIYADPGEPAHRQIYADFLLAAGDPRGEFIALQLAAAQTTPAREVKARMKELLAEHGAAWLGPLDHLLTRERQYACGFLASARVKLSPAELVRVAQEPAWRTLEALDNAPLALLAAQQHSPSLRSLAFDDPLGYALLASELVLPRVEQLELRFMATWRTSSYRSGTGFSSRFHTALQTTRALPKLRHLRLISDYNIDVSELARLCRAPLLAQLESMEVQLREPYAADALALRLPEHVASASPHINRLVVRSSRHRREFRRDPKGHLVPAS